MFFDDWKSLLRIVIVGILAYVSLIVMLRISGKRTLSKFNAFDLIVTIALGSTLATVLLSKDIALLEGLVAFAVLIGLQFIAAWLCARSETAGGYLKSEPQLLVCHGKLLRTTMRRERITEAEILAAMRSRGIASLAEVAAVILETDGTVSVIPSGFEGQPTALEQVSGFDQQRT